MFLGLGIAWMKSFEEFIPISGVRSAPSFAGSVWLREFKFCCGALMQPLLRWLGRGIQISCDHKVRAAP
jgi:hypothetical protein